MTQTLLENCPTNVKEANTRLKTVLIVSPRFAPINAADMHRIRLSLPYFRAFGWNPIVLTVDPNHVEGVSEERLCLTFPKDIPVIRVPALPLRWTSKVALGNIALRAMPFLYRSGAQEIKSKKVDLIYFSTTAFPIPILGPAWKKRFGVPFVVDIQDMWLSNYYRENPQSEPPPKFWFGDRLGRLTEPIAMRRADGLIAVSKHYIDTLRQRYPALANKPSLELPFGAADADFEIASEMTKENRFFQKNDGNLHGVYIGRGGPDMAQSLRTIFGAFKVGLDRYPEQFSKIKLYFVGTSYGRPGTIKKTIEPVIREFQLENHVFEDPNRIPYFDTLNTLLQADFLVVPGSDDPQYTASKIFPYILARKPLLAVFQTTSSVFDILKSTGAADPFPIDGNPHELCEMWHKLLVSKDPPALNQAKFDPYRAYEVTRQQCLLFDQVIASTNKKQASS